MSFGDNKHVILLVNREFNCKSRLTGPVSYTHLDVYKRQGVRSYSTH